MAEYEFDKKSFGSSLELFEIAKLRRKYEALGYEFRTNFIPRRRYVQTFRVDAYAKHELTGDEIVFEVKSVYKYSKQTLETIKHQRKAYSLIFPKARFVLVLAKEDKAFDFYFPQLTKLLFENIADRKIIHPYFIHQQVRADSVENIECIGIHFEGNARIDIQGYANFRFWYYVDEKEFRGEMLSDGVTFFFDAAIRFDQGEPTLESCNIIFDFSEFNQL